MQKYILYSSIPFSPIIFPNISISLYCVVICVATSKLKDFIIDWNSNSDLSNTVPNGWRIDFRQISILPLHMYMQMMTHPTGFRFGIGGSSEILCWTWVSSIWLCHLSKDIERDSFFELGTRFSKAASKSLNPRMNRLWYFSVGWALSWTRICQRSRSNCRSKWRGSLCNYILHEFFADRTYLLGQRGTEHHDLLAVWCASEYFLYVPAHICNNQCNYNYL